MIGTHKGTSDIYVRKKYSIVEPDGLYIIIIINIIYNYFSFRITYIYIYLG